MIDEQEQGVQVLDVLRNVIDPELGIDIVSLGLIYGITIENDKVDILMTLTVPGCPMHGTITQAVERAVRFLFWAREVKTHLTFDPPWTRNGCRPRPAELAE